MQNHLSLINTGAQDLEKRVFPRFPFTYLLFKSNGEDRRAYEVKDISFTGMQLCLRDGGHSYRVGEPIEGGLSFRGQDLEIRGEIMWVKEQRIGVAFDRSADFDQRVRSYLSMSNMVSGMRTLHDDNGLGLEMPRNLKYWLQSDGPVEVFVWCHGDGEISKFQMIMMDSFIEYQDGKGLRSGRVLTRRDLDTPLVKEGEFVFEIDSTLSDLRLKGAKELAAHIPSDFLPTDVMSFLKLKLGEN